MCRNVFNAEAARSMRRACWRQLISFFAIYHTRKLHDYTSMLTFTDFNFLMNVELRVSLLRISLEDGNMKIKHLFDGRVVGGACVFFQSSGCISHSVA